MSNREDFSLQRDSDRVVPHDIVREDTRAGVELTAQVPGWQITDLEDTSRHRSLPEKVGTTVAEHPIYAGTGFLAVFLSTLFAVASMVSSAELFYAILCGWMLLGLVTPVVLIGMGDMVYLYSLPVEDAYANREDAERIAEIISGLPESGRARRKAIRAVRDEVKKINTANEKRITAEVERQYAHALTAAQPAIATSGLSWDGAARIHDTVKQEYGEFLSNPLEVVSMPLLADSKLAEPTRLFERLLVVADDAKRSGDTTRYSEVVLDLSQGWDDAKEYAQLHGTNTLPVASQTALRRAKKLLAQALDDATPPHVAAAAVRQAEELLRGVMSMPPVTRGMLESAVRAELSA